jgi:hypothetical protein
VSRGLGAVQRSILAALADNTVDPMTDFDERGVSWQRYPSWSSVVELAAQIGLGDSRSAVESVRRAVLGLARAHLVMTRYVLRRRGFNEPQEMLAARLPLRSEVKERWQAAYERRQERDRAVLRALGG